MTLPYPSPVVVAAVVVTYNRQPQMQKTLARLLAEPLDHVIVVENGSTDGTREWLASLDDTRLDVQAFDSPALAVGFESRTRGNIRRDDDALAATMAAMPADFSRKIGQSIMNGYLGHLEHLGAMRAEGAA